MNTTTIPQTDTPKPAEVSIDQAATFLKTLFAPGDCVLVRPIETWNEGGKKKSHVDYRGIVYRNLGVNNGRTGRMEDTTMTVATTSPPSCLAVNPSGIPESLRADQKWVAWKLVFRKDSKGGGKWTKPLFRAQGSNTQKYAKSTDPKTWGPFSLALLSLRCPSVAGIGYVFSSQSDVVGIDLDHCRDPQSEAIEPWAVEIMAKFQTYQEISPSGTGVHIFARANLPQDTAGVKKGQIEVYRHSRYFTVTGHRLPGSPVEVQDCHHAVLELYEQLRRKGESLSPTVDESPPTARASKSNVRQSKEPTDEDIIARARTAANGCDFSPLWDGSWQGAYPSQSEADQALCNFLAFWTGPSPDRIDRLFRQSGLFRPKWDERHHSNGDTYGAATIKKSIAGRTEFYQWDRRPKTKKRRLGVSPQRAADAIPTIEFEDGRTEVSNGQRFARRFASQLRWCPEWKTWLAWDGTRWEVDLKDVAQLRAKDIYSAHWEYIATAKVDDTTLSAMMRFAKDTGKAHSIDSMLKLARSEPGIAVSVEKLDTDPWSLNVANGTLDLRTGQLREHRQEDLFTKLCPTIWDPAARCELWEAFLQKIMAGNDDLIHFLRRAVGMSLTGVVRDHALLVLYGKGQNGKSTFLNALQAAIGPDFAMKAPLGMLMAKQQEQHPTERADLFGRRFVSCIEVEDGQRMAESLIKELTGGDPVRARFMRKDFFEFLPTHHVWLAVNHRPEVRGTDTGIWRRIKLIPFTVSIPEDEQDSTLPEKLIAERPGILAWAVRGAVEWARDGLGEPNEVRQATGEYRQEQDVLAAFLTEQCSFNPGFKVRSSSLYGAYLKWCERTGEYYLNQRRFGAAMTERTFKRDHSNGTWYVGIALNEDPL